MSTTQRVVRKQLAGAEDLLQGVGVVQQSRGGQSYGIHKLDVPVPVSSVEEMQTLDVEFARVYTTDLEYTDYRQVSAGVWVRTASAEKRDAVARQAAEAGYNLVAGSFEEGGSLVNAKDVLWYIAGNTYLNWFDGAAKTVTAGSTPATSGGVGAGAWVDRTQDTLRSDLSNESIGTRLIGWVNSLSNSVVGTLYRWLSGRQVSVFDFMTEAQQADVQSFTGSIDVTEAVRNALLASRTVHMPQGRYKIVGNINPTKRHKLFGDGSEKTILDYYGTDVDAILAGTLTPEDYQKYIELSGFTVVIKDKTVAHNAVALENAVRFKLRDIWCVGAGNPNAQEVLTGNGLHIRKGSFIGLVSGCYAELFNYGLYEQNDDTNGNLWTAAIVYDQQCEFTNNNLGMVFGSTTNALGTSQGCTVRDTTVEFNYQGGILVNNAQMLSLDSVYCESNGNFDIKVGNSAALGLPVCVNIKNCAMPSANLTSPYGATPYTAKLVIEKGVFTLATGNDISNPSGGVCIDIADASDRASIHENRVNTTTSVKINDASTSTFKHHNYGDVPTPFNTPTYLNSWVAASGFQAPRFFKEQDIHGKTFIVIEGVVSGGAAGTTIFTLPLGYRPLNGRVDFATGQVVSGLSNGIAVTTDGSVICASKNSATVTLSGIRFCIS